MVSSLLGGCGQSGPPGTTGSTGSSSAAGCSDSSSSLDSSGSEPLELVPWREIVFVREHDERAILMTVDRDGSGLGPIHDGGGSAPRASANGRHLLWSEDGTLVLLHEGDAEPQPQQDLRLPTWAPANAQLAAIREADGMLVVLDAETGDERELLLTTDPHGLQWSADAGMLALHDGSAVYIVEVDSGASTELAAVEGPLELAWAPDGSALALGHHGVVEIASLATLELTTTIEPGLGSTAPVRVAWSPDGEWLAWIHEDDGGLVHPDGTDPRWLYLGVDGSPAWSPSAQRVAFRFSPSGDCGADRCAQARVYAPETDDDRRLAGVVQQMAWAPDADVLVHVRDPVDTGDPLPWRIATYDAGTDTVTELGELDPEDPREDVLPLWRPTAP